MTLAETLAAGGTPGHPRWPEVEAWAPGLGIAPTDALTWDAARAAPSGGA